MDRYRVTRTRVVGSGLLSQILALYVYREEGNALGAFRHEIAQGEPGDVVEISYHVGR